jgi:hypothetical protein
MAKGATDLAKAKAKKQKKIAIIGGVLFVALLAYQVPKTMKLLNQKPVAAAATPTPAVATPTPAETPVPGATPTTPAPATGGTAAAAADAIVVNADLAPAPLDGQLVALTRFSSKDPFAPQNQVTEVVPPSSTPPGNGNGNGNGNGSGSGSTPTPTTPNPSDGGGAFTPAPGTSPPGSSTPAPGIGTISVNTVAMAVTVKTDFPTDAPMFTLVSLTARAAKIAIAGGSLASGTKTLTLQLGKPVTLMNTADGTRFVLVYVGPGDKTTPAAPVTGGTATTATTTTPSAGTSTPTGRG